MTNPVYHEMIYICLAVLISLIMILLYKLLTVIAVTKTWQMTKDQELICCRHQLEIMQNNLNYWNHIQYDFKKNMALLESHLGDRIDQETRDFIFYNFKGFFDQNTVNCGVTIIDSILNYQIREAGDLRIRIEPTVIIPEELVFDNVDATLILNNIFTYARALVLPVDEKDRVITLEMRFKYRMHRLIFSFIMPLHPSQKNTSFIPPPIFEDTIKKYLGFWYSNDELPNVIPMDQTVIEVSLQQKYENRILILTLYLNEKNFPSDNRNQENTNQKII